MNTFELGLDPTWEYTVGPWVQLSDNARDQLSLHYPYVTDPLDSVNGWAVVVRIDKKYYDPHPYDVTVAIGYRMFIDLEFGDVLVMPGMYKDGK